MSDEPAGAQRLLPNSDKIGKRLLITTQNNLVILRPNEKRPPIYPKTLPYPYIPKNTPKKRGGVGSLNSKTPSPVVSDTESYETSKKSILKIKNSNAKKNDVNGIDPKRRSNRPKEKIGNYAVIKKKRHAETDDNAVQIVQKKKRMEAEDADSRGSSPVPRALKKKKQKEDELGSVPQRIENVIEEYENKVC